MKGGREERRAFINERKDGNIGRQGGRPRGNECVEGRDERERWKGGTERRKNEGRMKEGRNRRKYIKEE